MKEIKSEIDIECILKAEAAIVFFHADWSEYAMISKQMMEHVERYCNLAGNEKVKFWFGQLEGDLLPLAEKLVSLDVPSDNFRGSGGVSFFKAGIHLAAITSVIGEGTFKVNEIIDNLYDESS